MSDDSKKKSAVHLTADDFQKTIEDAKKAGVPVFVDFYADWCGPCQIAAPIVDKLAAELDGQAIIAKLNVDDHNQVAGQYGVMSIPTVIVFSEGEEVDRKIGFPGEAGYREMLAKVLPKAA